MRVVLTNAVTMNGGDAAIVHGIAAILRRALGESVDISVHDDTPGKAADRVPFDLRPQLGSVTGRARAPWRLRRRLDAGEGRELLDRYASADLVVSTGGTYLSDHYDLAPRIREFQLARALGRPLVLFTQSIGPVRLRATRRALRRELRDARLVLLRDERSRQELLSAGIRPQRVELTADAAFALADPAVLEAARRPRPPAGQPRVAISVRAWSHFGGDPGAARLERYLESMAALTRHLVERRGAHVTFLSTCQGVPGYAHDDSVVADAIAAGLPGSTLSGVAVDRGRHDVHALIASLGEFDLVVATRMHAAILALAGGTPVLPIAYEPKIAHLASDLGIERFLHRMEAVSARGLCAGADALIEGAGALRPELFARVEAQRQRALASGDLVREAFA